MTVTEGCLRRDLQAPHLLSLSRQFAAGLRERAGVCRQTGRKHTLGASLGGLHRAASPSASLEPCYPAREIPKEEGAKKEIKN